CRHLGDEELRSIGVGTAVGHGQAARLVEGEIGGELVLEAVAGIAAPCAVIERHALHHFAVIRVLPFLFAGGQSDEVGDGKGGLVGKQSAGDVAVGSLDDRGGLAFSSRLLGGRVLRRRRAARLGKDHSGQTEDCEDKFVHEASKKAVVNG